MLKRYMAEVSQSRLVPFRPRVRAAAAALLIGAGWLPSGVLAQAGMPMGASAASSQQVLLNAALARLGRNPRDIQALLDAGNASLGLSDVDAALGFFNRAGQLSPNDPRVRSGLAGAYVRKRDPFQAIPLFNAAERTGGVTLSLLGDRGLAYDLVGDSLTAQRYYREALTRANDDETVRRLSLSQAIAGDRRASETTLSPLIQRQDRAAWRTRAFALAILGYEEEAVSIAKSTMPPELASAMTPYLRYMRRLTRAQQAAAANLGFFPRAADVGRDDPRVALYAPSAGRAVGSALIPSGAPLGPRPAVAQAARAGRAAALVAPPPARPAAAVPPPDPRPRREETTVPATLSAAPAAAAVSPRSAPLTAPARTAVFGPAAQLAPVPVQSAQPAALPAPSFTALAAPATVSQPVLPVQTPVATQQPGFSAIALADPRPTTIATTPAATSVAPATPVSLSEAFADFAAPKPDAAPAPGAVDVRTIVLPKTSAVAAKTEAASPERTRAAQASAIAAGKAKAAVTSAAAKGKPGAAATATDTDPADKAKADPKTKIDAKAKSGEKAKPEDKAKATDTAKAGDKAKAPSRVWVQIATGRNEAALAFDWRRFTRENASVFKGRSGYISEWGRTNRLLTGPFASASAAETFVAQLRKAKVDGAFVWTSTAGQAVEPLGAK